MKKIILALMISFLVNGLFAQHAPVAVDDYATISLGDTVVINVVNNDYHPDNITFKINTADASFTDSTITIFLDFEHYWNWTKGDTILVYYTLVDENGNMGYESIGTLYLTTENKPSSFLDINNIKCRAQSAGIQFWSGPSKYLTPSQEHGFFFPKESDKITLFNTSIWVGGTDENDSLHLAGELYREYGFDFWPGPVGEVNGQPSAEVSNAIKWNRVWKLTKDEIIYHKFHYTEEGYQPIEAIATWPAHGDESLGQEKYLAPFVDADGDGLYDPMSGDYPLIRGDQCVFFILNDVRNHTETNGGSMGLEVHVMAYEFYNPDTLALQNTVFYSYKIFNRSQNTYHNTLLGLFVDLDIGFAFDDYLGCDVSRGLLYGYNSCEPDGNGEEESYGDTVPAQTVLILGGALMDANGEDNPAGQCDEGVNGVGFGDGVVDNERFGMTRFAYFNNGGIPALSDPSIAPDYMNYLNGLWKDGTAIEYGGNGHVSGGSYGPAARFVFPGVSDACNWGTNGEEPYGPKDWTMKSGGVDSADIRGVGVSGPFTFKPGDMQRFDIAYVSAFAEEGKSALETALDYSDFVKAKYLKNPDDFGYQYLGVSNKVEKGSFNLLKVWPNPVNSKVSFIYNGKENSAVYKVHSVTGKVVASGVIQNGETISVDVSVLPKGLFFINVTDSETIYSAKFIKQ